MSSPTSRSVPMPEKQQAGSSAVPARLHEVARILRDAHHLGPEAQKSLADLADQLANALGSTTVPSAEEVQLAQLASQVIESLHQPVATAPVAVTRHRLQEAIMAAESRAPFMA